MTQYLIRSHKKRDQVGSEGVKPFQIIRDVIFNVSLRMFTTSMEMENKNVEVNWVIGDIIIYTSSFFHELIFYRSSISSQVKIFHSLSLCVKDNLH